MVEVIMLLKLVL